jgi:hypothetical protein
MATSIGSIRVGVKVRLDFDLNLVQWHRFSGSTVALYEERPIF